MRSIAERCAENYGGHSYGGPNGNACVRCGHVDRPPVPVLEPRCMAPDCPAPAFVKQEPEPLNHVRLPDGRTYHFACRTRMVRVLLADPPTMTAPERAVQEGVGA